QGTLLVIGPQGLPSLYSMETGTLGGLGFDRASKIIGTVGAGVVVSTGESHFLIGPDKGISSPKWLEILKGNKLTAIFEGTQGIYWAATDGEGVFKVQPDLKP